MLEGTSGKEVRKIGAYAVMEILVSTSPYVTFKKLLQKQRNSNLDNLSLAISASRVKSIKVRQAYLQFLTEYVKYIAEKKDGTCFNIKRYFKKQLSKDFTKTILLFLLATQTKNSIISTSKP